MASERECGPSHQTISFMGTSLLTNPQVRQIETKKRSKTRTVDASSLSADRSTDLDGNGSLIAVVDSDFDLTHPMFKRTGGSTQGIEKDQCQDKNPHIGRQAGIFMTR